MSAADPSIPEAARDRVRPSRCDATVYWVDSAYVGRCVLNAFHAGPHSDGLELFDGRGMRVLP
jgi:hypothetical protein